MNFSELLKRKNIQLTSKQKEAVNFLNGILLLLAVPGAGKTTSIIARNANLILQNDVLAKDICNITFSKAAAQEMSNRFTKIFPELDMPYFSTIHSLSYKIVREYLNSKNISFILLEENQNPRINKNSILNNIYLKVNKEYPNEDTTEQVSNFISLVRNSLINLEEKKYKDFFENQEDMFNNPVIIYNKYMYIKKKNNWIDFDDMLCISNNILKINHPIAQKYKNRFKFIQVDEAQDISPVQYEIIKQLSNSSGNLCLIGDDDQTVYSFRGSNPQILLDFPKEFQNTKIIYMEQNFRSAPCIVDKCNNFIKGNKKRYTKNMYTKSNFDGKIKIKKHFNVSYQAKHIISLIKEENNFRNTAILYRNNSSALPIILECIKNNVPFNTSSKKIFKKFILEDLLNFYIFSNDPTNKEAFLNIAYKTNNVFIKKATLQNFLNNVEGDILSQLIKQTFIPIKNSVNLRINFNCLRESKNATQFLLTLFYKFNYKKYLLSKTDESVINILIALAENEKSIEAVITKISNLLDKIENKNYDPNGITIVSLHASKGLEWENVHIIDFNDNIIPNPKTDIEEERRLAYVGFSRAIKKLFIHYYTQGYKKTYLSPFLQEFNCQYKQMDFTSKNKLVINSQIEHIKFGRGTIIDIDNKSNILTIQFKNKTKKISKEVSLKNNLIKVI